jgi:hypothetical protein
MPALHRGFIMVRLQEGTATYYLPRPDNITRVCVLTSKTEELKFHIPRRPMQ